ncbi:hypothetical protein SPB21_03865 [Leptothoe sp. ISB3NOV94-8A]
MAIYDPDERARRRECPANDEDVARALNGFNHLALPSIPLQFKSKLPIVCCVYVAYVGSDIYYIGKTMNLKQRWQTHKPKLLVDLKEAEQRCSPMKARIGWLTVDPGILDFAEISLIQRCMPLMNVKDNCRYS